MKRRNALAMSAIGLTCWTFVGTAAFTACSPSPNATVSTPQEQADEIANGLYKWNPSFWDDLTTTFPDTDGDKITTFEPEQECHEVMSEESLDNVGMLVVFAGSILAENNVDVASLTKRIRQYNADIRATGICQA